jgi:hypothetical protein
MRTALVCGADEGCVAQVGWEQRGNHSYYYKKERDGAQVRSVYVGRGDVAHMVSQLQSSSSLIEKFARNMKSPEQVIWEQAEASLEQAMEFIEMMTHAALLAAGFHTHHRQWRRKRTLAANDANDDQYQL